MFADSAGMDGLVKERGTESIRQIRERFVKWSERHFGENNGFTFSQKQVPLNSFRVILLSL